MPAPATTPPVPPAGARPGGRLRHWLAGRTLRTRLIAGLVVLLFAACAAVGIVVYVGLRGFLTNQLDDQLVAASNRYVMCVDGPPADHGPGAGAPGQGNPGNSSDHDPDNQGHPQNPGICGNATGQAEGTFSAAVAPTTVAAADVTNGTCHLTAQDSATLRQLKVNGPATTAMLYSLDADYRLMAVRGSGGMILITGLPVGMMTQTLDNVALTEIIVFAAAVVLTGILGTGWVRLSLGPLRRVTATAAQVARLPLATQAELPHRVPGADPRTEVGQLGAAFNRMLGHVESAIARRHASGVRSS